MPRIAILSDPHANAYALQSVMHRLEEERPDIWICLGDLVGYGPNPAEVIQMVQSKDMICVKGNHDAGVTGELTLKHFRNPNRLLIEKTQSILSTEQKAWLKSLPYVFENEIITAAHATPVDPEKWKYVESAFTARDIISKVNTNIVLVGHTHKPVIVSNGFGKIDFNADGKYLINPGSVGQSRDGDYRASCAIIDTDKWEYKSIRVSFDMEPVLTGLMKLGFSRKEADRMMKV